jgi:hypothetical protein
MMNEMNFSMSIRLDLDDYVCKNEMTDRELISDCQKLNDLFSMTSCGIPTTVLHYKFKVRAY